MAGAGVEGAAAGAARDYQAEAGRDEERFEHDGNSGAGRRQQDRRGDHCGGADSGTPGSLDGREVDVRTVPAA